MPKASRLFKSLGTKFTPELKAPDVKMPFDGDYTQEKYAQQMIDEYKAAGIDPKNVFAQSFNLNDILYWIKNEPAFGAQATFLDDRYEKGVGLQQYRSENLETRHEGARRPGREDHRAAALGAGHAQRQE